MTPHLKPYPAYKDSGVPWLGEVPAHWEIERAKRLFRKMDRPVQTSDEVVTCFRDGVVTLRKNRRLKGFTESLKEIGYQGIRRGDLVIHAMDAFAGAVGVSDSDGKGTPVYSVCEPISGVNSYFYAYTIREMARSQWIQALAKGIRERSTDFRFDTFGSQPVPLPSFSEQTAIVRYLSYIDQRIRRYIRAKQKLIKLLEEQKQALIHRAVTGQIDVRSGRPYPAYKDSGVEWLGEVPGHWEVMPIKRAFLSMDYGISESASESGSIRFLTMGHLQNGNVNIPTSGGVDSVDSYLMLQSGDLLFNRTNSPELVGKVGLFKGHVSPVTFASYLVRMRPDPKNDPVYLNTILNDTLILSIVRREAIPSLHQSNLNPSRYGRLHIPLPPLNEQRKILLMLEHQVSKRSRSIIIAQHEIELLKEYRTRLIADVVTGKLDVRAAAERLPELPEAAAPEEETAETVEADIPEDPGMEENHD